MAAACPSSPPLLPCGFEQLLLQLDPELAVLPDMSANTPLHHAADTGNTVLVTFLLQHCKPEINMQNLNMSEYR